MELVITAATTGTGFLFFMRAAAAIIMTTAVIATAVVVQYIIDIKLQAFTTVWAINLTFFDNIFEKPLSESRYIPTHGYIQTYQYRLHRMMRDKLFRKRINPLKWFSSK